MKQKLIIVGIGATAVRVYNIVKMYDLYDVIGFAIDSEYIKEKTFMDLPIHDLHDIKRISETNDALVFVAIFWNNLNKDRRTVYERLKNQGIKFANIISPTAIIRGRINGGNCWINDYVVVQSNVDIAEDIFIMDTALIGNETKIGAHTFIAPSGKVGGGAELGEQCFVGINAVVFDDTKIGNRCIIGACTAIKRNLPDNTVCKVAVANTVTKEYSPEVIESKLRTNHNVR